MIILYDYRDNYKQYNYCEKGIEDMLAEERFSAIIKLVNERKTITVQELTELLSTSESTIRRDLTVLHKRNQLLKVHGGATTTDLGYSTTDMNVSDRKNLNTEEKVIIGRYAAKLIRKADFVYIDSGTSTDAMIDYIVETDAVYVTNGTQHAKKLVQRGCKAFLLGGEFKLATEAIVGVEALESLQRYNFTKGFFGVNGIAKQQGLTTPDISEAKVKSQALKQCKERFALADSSKMNHISAVTFAEFTDAIILTTRLKDKTLRKYQNVREVEEHDIYGDI